MTPCPTRPSDLRPPLTPKQLAALARKMKSLQKKLGRPLPIFTREEVESAWPKYKVVKVSRKKG